jgi:LysR family transcriptional activator of nhaA
MRAPGPAAKAGSGSSCAGRLRLAEPLFAAMRRVAMPVLRQLNFKHLRYFTAVAARGSITGAARDLHVAPQTVSSQLAELESAMGRQLFDRVGKRLELNADGDVALQYAKKIFALGEELVGIFAQRNAPRRIRLRIGVTDSVPKLLATKLLAPVVAKEPESLELTCTEAPLNELLSQALGHRLDLVLADAAPSIELSASLRVHLLANPGLSFLASAEIAERYPGRFPRCLDGMPFLLWSTESAVALALQQWFGANGVNPTLTGRFEDSALMKAFAERGLGAVAVPTIIENEVCRHHGLRVLGRTPDIHQPVYAIVPQRQRLHTLVEALLRSVEPGVSEET